MLVSFREKREQDIKANFNKVMPTKQNKTNNQTNKQTKQKQTKNKQKTKNKRRKRKERKEAKTGPYMESQVVYIYFALFYLCSILLGQIDFCSLCGSVCFVPFQNVTNTWYSDSLTENCQTSTNILFDGSIFFFFFRTNILLSLRKLYISLSILFHLILTAPPPKETSLREPLSLGEKK